MKRIVQVRYPKKPTADWNSASADEDGYSSTQKYSFYTDIEDLKVGDIVAVPYARGKRFICCKVVETEEGASGSHKAEKWIVSKIDVEGYTARVETAAKYQEMKALLDKAVAKARQKVEFDTLAKEYPEIADLAAQVKALSDSVD